jgi:hypothetical protein
MIVAPLDTPPDWHSRIATRQHEWRTLGPEAAMTLWQSRGECSNAVRDAMLAHIAAERAQEAARRG